MYSTRRVTTIIVLNVYEYSYNNIIPRVIGITFTRVTFYFNYKSLPYTLLRTPN